MKRAKLEVREYPSKTSPFYVDLRPWGKGRVFFRNKTDAKAALRQQRDALNNHGESALKLPTHELAMFIEARKRLASIGKTIREAVDFFLDHETRIRRSNVTVAQLTDELIGAKIQDGRSKRYIDDLRSRLPRFCQHFGNRPIASVTYDEVNGWLRALPLSAQSRINYRQVIAALFSEAVRRGIIDNNPVLRTAKPRLPEKPPEVFTVDQLRCVLEAAQRTEPSVVPMLAIGAFAGLRDAEIKRLHWQEIDLARRFVEVTAAKAKSARRRIVPIQPNLTEWLKPYSGKTGHVVPDAPRGKLERVRKAAGLTTWPNNGLRHSFASYRLAAIHDAPRVASELGHTSPQMLYNTYRELVLPEEAERYWKIQPAGDAANVVPFSAS